MCGFFCAKATACVWTPHILIMWARTCTCGRVGRTLATWPVFFVTRCCLNHCRFMDVFGRYMYTKYCKMFLIIRFIERLWSNYRYLYTTYIYNYITLYGCWFLNPWISWIYLPLKTHPSFTFFVGRLSGELFSSVLKSWMVSSEIAGWHIVLSLLFMNIELYFLHYVFIYVSIWVG